VESQRTEIYDLQIALATSNEHGDMLQDHLYRLTTSLAAEVQERQRTEEKLQKVLQTITQEKGDLEILVQILIEQGDASAEDSKDARVDVLTRIANRRGFDEHLGKEWKRHIRAQRPLALLICDVDHFKRYNDHYGHQAGDDCLRRVAKSLSQGFRASDVTARYGGEEFAMILPDTDRAAASVVAELVRAAVQAAAIPHTGSPISDYVTVSVGIGCRVPQRGEDMRTLVEEADRNLYLAKQLGRNCVAGSHRTKELNYDKK
jgi:diguanylate cyclase (GGDEF)-like protein